MVMEENVKKLLMQAFEGDAVAWRQLALLFTAQDEIEKAVAIYMAE